MSLHETSMNRPAEHSSVTPEIPDYLQQTYWWAYLHPKAVRFFEHQWIVNSILWGNFARLRDGALDAMGNTISGRTLQVACVYGDFTPRLADRLAPGAHLDVVDVAAIQLENLQRKTGERANVVAHRQNAATLKFGDAVFDQVVLFFLLHELPAEVRRKAVQEALRVVKPGGKVVFVDYHRPVRLHPLRLLMRLVLKTLEPFALDLWRTEIADWTGAAATPTRIDKSSYFGGLYQMVIMTR